MRELNLTEINQVVGGTCDLGTSSRVCSGTSFVVEGSGDSKEVIYAENLAWEAYQESDPYGNYADFKGY